MRNKRFRVLSLLSFSLLVPVLTLASSPVESKMSQEGKQQVDKGGEQKFEYAKVVRTRSFFIRKNHSLASPYVFVHSRLSSFSRAVTSSASLPIFLFGIVAKGVKEGVFKPRTVFEKGGVPVSFVDIVRPRLTAIQFSGFDQIILTMPDGSLKVYDSDDYDINNVVNSGRRTEWCKSNNPRSINSKQFIEDLKVASKASFLVREGMFWSDYRGRRTKYRIRAKDFLPRFLFEKLDDIENREVLGGSKELNEYYDKRYGAKFFSNSFIRRGFDFSDLYSIDRKSLYDYDNLGKNKPIENLVIGGRKREALSIYRLEDRDFDKDNPLSEGGLYNWFVYFFNSFYAYPTEYTEEVAKRSNDDKLGKGIVRKIGYYTYGADDKDVLYAGNYILKKHEVVGGNETFQYVKNPNFFDKKWLADINNVRERWL